MRLDEHMNFMDILQNPTKHMSQVEKRRKKLGEIGIEVGDIEAMPVEDSDTNLQPIKKPPKEIDANDTFPKYNFKVSFNPWAPVEVQFSVQNLTADELRNSKKYQDLIKRQRKKMNDLITKLARGNASDHFSVFESFFRNKKRASKSREQNTKNEHSVKLLFKQKLQCRTSE